LAFVPAVMADTNGPGALALTEAAFAAGPRRMWRLTSDRPAVYLVWIQSAPVSHTGWFMITAAVRALTAFDTPGHWSEADHRPRSALRDRRARSRYARTSCRPAGCLRHARMGILLRLPGRRGPALDAGLIDGRGLVTRGIKRTGAHAGAHDGGRGRASARLPAAVEDCRAQRRC